MRKVVILCSAYFFINSCVYSAHNYMLKIISSTNHLTPKQFAVLDMLLFVKFLGSFFWTNMADRTNMHRTIIAGGLMGYAIFLSMFRYPIPGMEANGLNFYTIFYYIMFTFFLSAVYATLDAFCLEYLESKKKERKLYGIIKLFGCFGHSFGPICLTLLSKDTKTVRDNTTPIIQSLVFAFIGSAQIMLTFGYLAVKKKAKVEKKEPLNKRIRQNLISIKKLFTVSLGLLLLSVSLQGIHRNIVTTYLELYAEECGISRHSLSCAFAARVIPEASMLFLTGVIDKAIGTYWMIFIGIFFGIFRPLLYSVLNPKTISPTILLFFVYVSEILKGCFSGLFNYSCSKLVKELSTHNTKSLAQGLYNGCYSGLAPCAAGVIAYLLIESPKLKIYDSNVRFLFFSTAILGLVGVIPLVILIMAKIRKEKKIRNEAICMNDINSADDMTVKMVDGNESAA